MIDLIMIVCLLYVLYNQLSMVSLYYSLLVSIIYFPSYFHLVAGHYKLFISYVLVEIDAVKLL